MGGTTIIVEGDTVKEMIEVYIGALSKLEEIPMEVRDVALYMKKREQ